MNGLAMFFKLPRKRSPRPQYEVIGDDGQSRAVSRDGRKFSATVAPGVTAHWDSLRQARAEGYAVRRRA